MKAVAYCRYSTDNQTENSIAYQLNEIQQYCASHNFTLINAYTDEARSGTNTNRNGLQRMLADAQRNLFDVVVIYDQSRLSRHILDWFNVRETLRDNFIDLHSCTEKLDNEHTAGSGFLSEGVRALFNHQFVLDTRAKTIAGQTAKAKQGIFLGGTPPLGYDIIDGEYFINPFEAEGVRMIFELYANGFGYGYIVQRLKAQGIKSKRGAIIGENALYAILRNERYIGIYTWNKTKQKYLQKWAGGKPNPNLVRLEGAIPPIISMEVWKKVQNKIADRKERAQNAAGTAKTDYLLSGLVKCGECGSAYTGYTTTSSKGYKTRYYGCGGKRRLHNCKAKNINADELEVLIVAQVERDILNSVILERVADDILTIYKENSGDNSRIKHDISECDRGINNLLNAIQKGLDAELGFERIDELKTKKNTLELQLSQFTTEIPSRESVLAVLRKDIDLLHNNRKENIKAIIQKYITSITLTDESIIISCLGDLGDKNKVTPSDNSNGVTKTGCGGRT